MRYEQPIPFYMAYPFLLPLDQEQAQEKDLQVMKSFYSRRAARIQEKADRECDRMEYDGSMMFDEYPDKFMKFDGTTFTITDLDKDTFGADEFHYVITDKEFSPD